MPPTAEAELRAALRTVDRRFGEFKDLLCELVRVPGVSADGFPDEEVRRSAEATAAILRRVGFDNVALLDTGGAHPAVYADWRHATGAPTVLVYGHHDVVPAGAPDRWVSPPFEPVERKGRLYGRGTADDKGGFMAWVAAASAYLAAVGRLPVNLKFLIEGEEEIGSSHLPELLQEQRSKLDADAVVVADLANFATGIPALTWQLRGIVQVDVEVSCLDRPVHSGDFGGAVPDAVRILCRILAGLRAKDGSLAVPGLYRRVARPSPAVLRRLRRLPFSASAFRRSAAMLAGAKLLREARYTVYQQLWTRPSLTVIAIESHPLAGAANQILDSARARLSMRTVPNMDSRLAGELLVRALTARPAAGAHVNARVVRWTHWWTTDPQGPVFDAALRALEAGYRRKPVLAGAGGSIGFLRPFSEAFRGVPCLLTAVRDPASAAHSENESLHLGDWKKAIRSAVHLHAELGGLRLSGPGRPRRPS